MNYLDLLKAQFNGRMNLREKRPGILQLLVPLFHEDGDMVDIFLEESKGEPGKVRVSDYGMTLMRLSYSFEIDTPNKEKIFQRILSENGVTESEGNLFLEAKPESLYPAVLQFAQTVAKVSSMSLYKRGVIEGLFYELVDQIVEEDLAKFHPRKEVAPVPARDDLEARYAFDLGGDRQFYLFAVRSSASARLATICCLEFQKLGLRFKSLIVHEEAANLSRKDLTRITSAADKQFVSVEDFRQYGRQYFEREASLLNGNGH